ncbi:MAG: hypothetical protein MUC43_01120 [Pirellula sp.]|nr:hypothetical protein [Pirellula sp.]
MLQVVFVKWGTRYDASSVNRHVKAIRKNSTTDVRFVCITDNAESNLDPSVETVLFPEFRAPFDSLKRGCRLKLSIFAKDIIDPDLPTIFLDLDTLICGDVHGIESHIRKHRGISMLQNHYVQWWPYQNMVRHLAPEAYYFGNSSAIGFYPKDYHFLFEEFNRVVDRFIDVAELPKKYHSDERFISYAARETLRVFPSRLIVKFAEEYMAPFLTIERIRKSLPWVKRRRKNLVAVTFVSEGLKPNVLVNLKRGDIVRYKRLVAKWDHQEYSQYWCEAA